jgi:hypothetical protein
MTAVMENNAGAYVPHIHSFLMNDIAFFIKHCPLPTKV